MAIIFDGQAYDDPAAIPDMGSLECTDVVGNKRSYFGFVSDRDKLPTYDGLASGSDATLVDPTGGSSTIVLYYHKPTKTWYPL